MRASDYPVPDYAAYLWHRGDGLMLSLPDSHDAKGQTLFIPLTKLDVGESPGWKFLLHTLAARRTAVQAGQRTSFGTASKPTAQQLEAALRQHQIAQRAQRATDDELFTEELTKLATEGTAG